MLFRVHLDQLAVGWDILSAYSDLTRIDLREAYRQRQQRQLIFRSKMLKFLKHFTQLLCIAANITNLIFLCNQQYEKTHFRPDGR